MSSFALPQLKAIQTSPRDVDALLFDSAPVQDPPGAWTLQPDVRNTVLSGMSADTLSAAVRASSEVAPGDDALRGALTKLTSESSPVASLDIAGLSALAPLAAVLQRAIPDLPPREELERRLEYLRLLEPFERLVGNHFAGRREELKKLSDYADVLPPEDLLGKVSRLLTFTRKAPLLIYGVGGVGKSTLMAKFILDHARHAEEDRFPFAYLDFDRPPLMPSEPATILVETVRQIGLQYPVAYGAAERLCQRWTELLDSSGQRRASKSAGSADARVRQRVLNDFVQFLATLDVIRGPLLLVLDTFEEVQHRSSVYVRELMKFLDMLASAVPRLRTVLSGRAVVPDIKLDRTIALADFDAEAALAFLTKESPGIDAPLARAIIKQVGGNPLTLRLAAAVALEKGETSADGIRGLETHTHFGLIRVKKSHIQGQLFRRILDHVKNEDVKKIAHPGLVLRRITPDLIKEVLAKPCRIDVPTKQRAQELFKELQREVALVSPAGKDVLEHRPDVRRLMLGGLRETKRRETREIDERAAEYYAQQPGVVPRAEEIYHRLVLGEPLEEIARLFLDGVQEFLGSAIEELPAPEKAFLAERLGVDLPPDAIQGATQQVWERAAIRRVQEALDADSPESALHVLAERTERSPFTMLRVHEVMALVAAGRLDDAARRAAEAIEAYAAEGNLLGVFETQLADAEIARRRGDAKTALQKIAGAEDMARATKNDLEMIRVLVARRLALELTSEDLGSVRSSIVKVAANIDDETWTDEPVLLRLAASGSADASLLARAVRLVGFTRLLPRQRAALTGLLHNIEEAAIATRLEAMKDDSKASTEYVIVGFVADALRNDTYAARGDEEQRSSGVQVNAETFEIAKRIAKVGLDPLSLRTILDSFNQSLEALSFAFDDIDVMVRDAVAAGQQQGWLPALIDAVGKAVPTNGDFLTFVDSLGLGITVEDLRGDSISREQLRELLEARRTDIAGIESRICRVESRDKLLGTGFLIDPITVLTATDVVGSHDTLTIRFDAEEKDGQLFAPGIVASGTASIRLHETSSAPSAVIVSLDRPVGHEPVAESTGARGWFDVRAATPPSIRADAPLLWLWHEKGLRIGGSRQVVDADEPVVLLPVRPRSLFAGAPCFDMDLNLVAIHCGAHPRLKRESIARPIATISEALSGLWRMAR
jgi:hypothetical protein